ncbi:Uncharacterized protein PECH_006095 [Penicillium ucsense]|uniref:Uncharacterized protein n=1 Tax=Penicillium ucsense TaxID=2839758 RepID=A0A8J8VZA1_9EURO|nr:Uncharacterized protein PECM_008179 [Penicillium ucsense]KAF7735848.1 Uncharacterized protein PECH_006095 [Penicillium ucsense]
MSQPKDTGRENLGPGPLTPPERGAQVPRSKPHDYAASDPEFVPGFSFLRVEQARRMAKDEDRTRLINSITDDIVATVIKIRSYFKTGVLSDDNIYQLDTVLQTIGHNNLKAQERLERKLRRLERKHCRLQQEYVRLARGMDAMGTKYTARLASLEHRTNTLRNRLDWLETGGQLHESRSRRKTALPQTLEKKESPELMAIKIEATEGTEGEGEISE